MRSEIVELKSKLDAERTRRRDAPTEWYCMYSIS
jgi:hypothetical protein